MLIGTLAWPPGAAAQEGEGYWRHYTTANSGLLANAIRALAYTEDTAIDLAIPGLWIGTGQGLNYTNNRDWVGYTTANSPLPDDTIHALYKDAADRDLWIATEGGLAHFDYGGTPRDPTDDQWEVFTTAEGLPANRVLSLAAGEGAELWAGTAKGVARYNGTTWAPYTDTTQAGEVRDLRYDAARNRVWAATEQGVGWIEVEANVWIPLEEGALDVRLSGSDARALAIDQDGYIWAGMANGMTRLDPDQPVQIQPAGGLVPDEGGQGETFPLGQLGRNQPASRFPAARQVRTVWTPDMGGLPDAPITDLAFDPTGRYLWVTTDGGGASRYDTAAQRWSRLTTPGSALPDAHVQVVLPSHEGLTWLGTASGLSGVEQLWETTHFTALPDPQSLPAYALIASWMDPESGTLWVASEGGGVSRSNDGGFTWETFTTAEGLGSNSILALWGDDSGIWAGTDGSGVSHTTDGGATWQTFTTEQGLGDDVITALWGDGAGTLWVGTYGGGISLTADDGATWQTLTPDPALGLDSVFNIRGDEKGAVWVNMGYGNLAVTSDGGQSWEAVTVSVFSTDALDNPLLPRPALWSDARGYMWVGTYGQGLARTGDRGKHWEAFTTAEGLGSDAITTLWSDDQGTLWVGTDGGGVSRTTDGGATWQTFTTEQGLAADTVSAIWGDPERGTVWVATWVAGAGIAGSPSRLAISRSDDGGASWKLFDVSPENVLGSDEITAIWSSDTAGALWVGLYDRGVARSTDNGTSWQTFTPKQGVGSPYVTAIWEDASALWVGTKGGGVSRTVNRGQSWETFTTAAGLGSNDVLAVWGDRLGVWVGTDGGGVSFSDDDGASWRTFTAAQGLGDNTVRAIHGDRTGIWAGTQSGLSFSEDDGATWQTFTTTHGLGSDAISALWVDRRGNVWVGTQGGGISRSTDGGASWQTFSLIERTGSNTVVALWGDDTGSIWVCTNSGISRTTDDGRTWQTFTHDESWGRGARLNTLWGDAAGGIWAGTTQGLSRLRAAPGLPTLPQWTAPEQLNTRATFRLLDAQVLEAQFAGLRFAPASESRAVQYTAVLSPTIPGASVLTQTFAVGEIGPLGIAPVTFGEGASPLAFGDYSLRLTARDAFGSQVTTTRTVEVQARPILTQAPAQQEGPGHTVVLVSSLPGGTAPLTLTLAVEDPDSPGDTFALEYAWDPTPDSLWQPVEAVVPVTADFAPGDHLLALRATDKDGNTSAPPLTVPVSVPVPAKADLLWLLVAMIVAAAAIGTSVATLRHYPEYAGEWTAARDYPLQQIVPLLMAGEETFTQPALQQRLQEVKAFSTDEQIDDALTALVRRGLLLQEGEGYRSAPSWIARLHQLRKRRHIPALAERIRTQHPLYARARDFFNQAHYQIEELGPEEFLLMPQGQDHPLGTYGPIYARLMAGRPSTGDDFTGVCEAARRQYTRLSAGKPIDLPHRVAMVISDRRPEPGARYRLYEIRQSRGLAIVPLDSSLFGQIKSNRAAIDILMEEIDQATGQQNLYAISSPVSSDLTFFGRERVLQELIDLLDAGQPVGIFGLRKAGKTSLIQRLQGKLVRRPIAFVDTQGTASQRGVWPLYPTIIAAFVTAIRHMRPDLTLPVLALYPDAGEPSPETTEHFLHDLRLLHSALGSPAEKERMLLIVDEIDRLLPDDTTPGYEGFTAFFGQLRAANQQAHLLDVLVAGVDPAINRYECWEERDNEFYRALHELWVPPMAPADVREMIESLGWQMGVRYEAKALTLLAQGGGGHPFVIRQLCSYAVKERLGRGAITVTLEQAQTAIEEFVFQDPYLRELWDKRLNEIQCEMLRTLARSSSPVPRSHLLPPAQRQAALAALKGLEEYTLIRRTKEGYIIAWNVLRNWVRWVELGLDA